MADDITNTPEWAAGYIAGLSDRGPIGLVPDKAEETIFGAYLIVGATIPVQRIYMHPFTLANAARNYGAEELLSIGLPPDPLTEEMERLVEQTEKLRGVVLR